MPPEGGWGGGLCAASCYDMSSSDFVTNPGEVTSARSHSPVRLRGGRGGVGTGGRSQGGEEPQKRGCRRKRWKGGGAFLVQVGGPGVCPKGAGCVWNLSQFEDGGLGQVRQERAGWRVRGLPEVRIPRGTAGLAGGPRQVGTRLRASGNWAIGGRVRPSMGAAWRGLGAPGVGIRYHP